MPAQADSTQSVDGVFRALADPTRRQVLERLNRSPASVSELAKPFNMALPSFLAAPENSRKLRPRALRKDRPRPDLSARAGAPAQAEDWLAKQRTLWERRLDQLDRYLLELKEKSTMTTAIDHQARSEARPRPGARHRRAARTGLGRVDDARAPQAVVLPAAVDDTECEIDLRPGGIFRTVMRSPEGQEFPNIGCYLEVVPNERLVLTDALLPGYRPAENPFFTAALTARAAAASGTRYVAIAIHRDEAGRKKHEEMGFHEGWGTVVDQMVEYVKKEM